MWGGRQPGTIMSSRAGAQPRDHLDDLAAIRRRPPRIWCMNWAALSVRNTARRLTRSKDLSNANSDPRERRPLATRSKAALDPKGFMNPGAMFPAAGVNFRQGRSGPVENAQSALNFHPPWLPAA